LLTNLQFTAIANYCYDSSVSVKIIQGWIYMGANNLLEFISLLWPDRENYMEQKEIISEDDS